MKGHSHTVTIASDGPSRMVKRPTGSDGEPSSPNCESSAGVKARHPSYIGPALPGLQIQGSPELQVTHQTVASAISKTIEGKRMRQIDTTATVTRRIDALLGEYGESHLNVTNKLIHWLCVPAITWCVFAGFYLLPYPDVLGAQFGLNWMWLAIAASLAYYLMLSAKLAVGLMVVSVACAASIHWFEATQTTNLGWFAAIVFVLAWVGQFIGHKIEGKKPSFLKDIQFLLIGPAWLLSFVYRKLGLRY